MRTLQATRKPAKKAVAVFSPSATATENPRINPETPERRKSCLVFRERDSPNPILENLEKLEMNSENLGFATVEFVTP
jgi:hypothetical protein